MGNDLEIRQPQPPARLQASLNEQLVFAKALSSAGLLPASYKEKPANILLAMQMADALGMPLAEVFTSINVIEGKPTMSADLIASRIRQAGHKLRISRAVDANGQPVVTATLIRRDDPGAPFTAVWDMARASRAGLAGKGNWVKYPEAMLQARAITEVARQGASDVLHGVIYTPEELGGDGGTLPPVEMVDVATGEVLDGEIVEDAPAPAPPITPGQRMQLGACLRDAGITSSAEGLGYYESVIGRAVKSTNDLTEAEAARIIDDLTPQSSFPEPAAQETPATPATVAAPATAATESTAESVESVESTTPEAGSEPQALAPGEKWRPKTARPADAGMNISQTQVETLQDLAQTLGLDWPSSVVAEAQGILGGKLASIRALNRAGADRVIVALRERADGRLFGDAGDAK